MEIPHFLPDGLMSELDVKLMLFNAKTYSDHVTMCPRENVRVFLQNGQECNNLLLGEGGFGMYLFRSVVYEYVV